jgi:cytochrome b involved in lipid metabolism
MANMNTNKSFLDDITTEYRNGKWHTVYTDHAQLDNLNEVTFKIHELIKNENHAYQADIYLNGKHADVFNFNTQEDLEGLKDILIKVIRFPFKKELPAFEKLTEKEQFEESCKRG